MSKRFQEAWSDEAVARLRELLDDKAGLSSAQIAVALNERFGMKLTRNAVLGKKHRLGLGESRAEPAPSVAAVPDVPSMLAPPAPAVVAAPPEVEPVPAPPLRKLVPKAFPLPPAGGYSILEVPMGACRYPVGPANAPFRCCGQKAIPGKSWCREHYAVCFPDDKQMRDFKRRQAAQEQAA